MKRAWWGCIAETSTSSFQPCCTRSAKLSCRCWVWLRGLLLLHSFHFSWACFMLQMAYGLKVLSHRLCSAGRLLQQGGFGLCCQSCCLTLWAEEAVGWVEVSCVEQCEIERLLLRIWDPWRLIVSFPQLPPSAWRCVTAWFLQRVMQKSLWQEG